ncbi:MAG: cation:proton antiporter [candidate division WOR-3 bacterium]|nr:cation:proton antiporter [candidate division WOR-3 bacterium]
MFELVRQLLSKISIQHLNILVLLGIALFGGTIGGRVFQKLKIPQVVGYIALGILIGQSGIKIIDKQIINALTPFSYFALGLIGFIIGGELKKDVIAKYGKQFLYVLISEGVAAFIVVSLLVGIAGTFLFHNPGMAWAIALLLGAIASATAPAATASVIWEYKARGPLTRTVLGIVAMDDALALLLFALASSIASRLAGTVNESILSGFIHPIYEIIGSIVIGAASGFVLSKLLRRYREEDRILAFSIGTVLLVLGISIAMKLDMILAAMFLGVTVVNFTPRKSKEVFKLVERFAPPIYVLFFVLVGAKLNVKHLNWAIIIIGLIYIIARSLGKMSGANFGARVSRAEKSVQKYLPLCLFSQAGVAIGLSLLAYQRFPEQIGNAIVIIITAATFILEILGPSFVRLALIKAKEVGLDITEDDIIRQSRAKDILDKQIPLVYENMSLGEILRIFGESDSLYYPVVNSDEKLLGIITIDNIKKTLAISEFGAFLLAHDLMEPVIAVAAPDTALAEVKEILSRYGLEYLPVVAKDNKVLGLLEVRSMQRQIAKRLIEMREKADALG